MSKTISTMLITLMLGLCSQAQNWITLKNAPTIRGKQDDIFFIDAERGWSVNGQGNIYKTTDGGKTWHKDSSLGPLINRFRFVDGRVGYAIGMTIYKIQLK